MIEKVKDSNDLGCLLDVFNELRTYNAFACLENQYKDRVRYAKDTR